VADLEINSLRQRQTELEAENAHLRATNAVWRAREIHQRAIIESAVDLAIIATDRDGLITDWNPGAKRILGWSVDEMRGEPLDRFFTPEDRLDDRIALEMRRALDHGCANDERWHVKRDGSLFWAKDETVPLQGDDGSHLGFLTILRDRTRQKLLEVELQTREAHFRAALAIARLGTFEWNIQTGTVRLDDRSRDIFGFRPDEGRRAQEIFDCIEPRDFERVSKEAQASSV
jgi:PAS domain S-box-containing protein